MIFGRFGIRSQADADLIRPMAYNQGFYNLALAIGVLVGVVLVNLNGNHVLVGKTLLVFGASCMALAGVILASTGRSYRPAAVVQFTPAVLTVVLTLLS